MGNKERIPGLVEELGEYVQSGQLSAEVQLAILQAINVGRQLRNFGFFAAKEGIDPEAVSQVEDYLDSLASDEEPSRSILVGFAEKLRPG